MQTFHDWFLVAVSAEPTGERVIVEMLNDNKLDRATLVFDGAPRCLVNGFAAQNIVYEMTVIDDFSSTEYQSAIEALEEAHPWGRDWPKRKIACVTSSLGAEMLVEYESLRITYGKIEAM